jgi:heme exporter protein D
MEELLNMGGYAAFVWPAYGLTALVIGGLVAETLLTLRARERELKTLQALLPSRRGRTRDGGQS